MVLTKKSKARKQRAKKKSRASTISNKITNIIKLGKQENLSTSKLVDFLIETLKPKPRKPRAPRKKKDETDDDYMKGIKKDAPLSSKADEKKEEKKEEEKKQQQSVVPYMINPYAPILSQLNKPNDDKPDANTVLLLDFLKNQGRGTGAIEGPKKEELKTEIAGILAPEIEKQQKFFEAQKQLLEREIPQYIDEQKAQLEDFDKRFISVVDSGENELKDIKKKIENLEKQKEKLKEPAIRKIRKTKGQGIKIEDFSDVALPQGGDGLETPPQGGNGSQAIGSVGSISITFSTPAKKGRPSKKAKALQIDEAILDTTPESLNESRAIPSGSDINLDQERMLSTPKNLEDMFKDEPRMEAEEASPDKGKSVAVTVEEEEPFTPQKKNKRRESTIHGRLLTESPKYVQYLDKNGMAPSEKLPEANQELYNNSQLDLFDFSHAFPEIKLADEYIKDIKKGKAVDLDEYPTLKNAFIQNTYGANVAELYLKSKILLDKVPKDENDFNVVDNEIIQQAKKLVNDFKNITMYEKFNIADYALDEDNLDELISKYSQEPSQSEEDDEKMPELSDEELNLKGKKYADLYQLAYKLYENSFDENNKLDYYFLYNKLVSGRGIKRKTFEYLVPDIEEFIRLMTDPEANKDDLETYYNSVFKKLYKLEGGEYKQKYNFIFS